MSPVDRYRLAVERMQSGRPLSTREVADLVDRHGSTVVRAFADAGVKPAHPAAGSRSAYWSPADVLAVFPQVEVPHG